MEYNNKGNKPTAVDIWSYVQRGIDYNNRLDYYNINEKNERYAFGDQWLGVKSKGLPTPTINIFKRVINYMVAYLVSTPIKVSFTIQNISSNTEDPEEKALIEAGIKLNKVEAKHWEDNKFDYLIKDLYNDGVLSGDMAIHTYWDSEIETGQDVTGDYVDEKVDGCNIILSNPNDRRINHRGKPWQKWCILTGRDEVERLREEARTAGVPEEEVLKIVEDSNNEHQAGERAKIEMTPAGKATYAIYYYYEKETDPMTGKKICRIYWTKSVRNVIIREAVPTKNRIYPLSWSNWETRKNSYHGNALLTNYIENQQYINKQLSMMLIHYQGIAIPKVAYNKNKINSWNNQVSGTIPVDGDVEAGTFRIVEGASMPAGISQLITQVISETIQALGANDVLLGNVKPDNTSAIIKVTEQANVPLLNQMMNMYDLIEQVSEIHFDFIRGYYGDIDRQITVEEDNEQEVIDFNASSLMDKMVKPKIEVGPSNWWSENKQVETLDNLFAQGILDVTQYLKRMPDGYIPKLAELIKEIESAANMQGQYEMMAQYFDQLPPEEQARLQALPDDQKEQEIIAMMNGESGMKPSGQAGTPEEMNAQREAELNKLLGGMNE